MKRRKVLLPGDELLQPEREFRAEGFCWIAGVDEAGRGPLAGPVTAGAVVFPPELAEYPGVFDSKQLSSEAREEILAELESIPGIQIGLGVVDAAEIDRINILKAAHLAMFRAVEKLQHVECVLVDGLPVKGFKVPARTLIKGDARSASIAAASIVAKVHRDRMMVAADAEFPQYGFALHKGYGTAAHLAALKKYGASVLHRKSFAPVRAVLPDAPEQLGLDF